MSSKKSEVLEVRLSHPLKIAFMARCRAGGASASETVRGLIEGYLAAPAGSSPSRRAPSGKHLFRFGVAGAAALALGAVAAPSLARPSLQASFNALDARHSGRLSFEEFAAGASVSVNLADRAARAPAPALPPQLRDAVLRAEFAAMDADHDGAVSFEEFRRYYRD
jgi:hypothetical protein